MARLNLNIDQGSTFSKEHIAKNDDGTVRDLTGYTVSSQIRKVFRSTNISATLVTALLDDANGKITMNLPPADTTLLKPGRYVWDLELTSPGTVDIITEINIVAGGSGYASAPVTITGGGGTGATATANIVSGIITSVTVTAPGSGYTTDPLIAIGGDGTGATATAKRGARVERILEGVVRVSPEVTK